MSAVECPICFSQVPTDFINYHLDSNCTKYAAKRLKPSSHCSRQSTLTNFLGLSTTHLPLPYFCLGVQETTTSGIVLEQFECAMQRDLPVGFKVLFEFKCKSYKQPLYLCSNLTSELVDLTPKTVSSWFADKSVLTFPANSCKLASSSVQKQDEYRNMSAMKSHLQKAIRRGMAFQSVLSALHMIKMPAKVSEENSENTEKASFDGIIQVCRRLLVIQAEDVMLSKYCPLITWIMVYFSKVDGLLRKPQYESKILKLFSKKIHHLFCIALLEFAEHLSTWRERDAQPSSYPATKLSLERLNMHRNQHERTILSCLGIRADYGGMSCDVEMLHQTSHQWYARFNSTTAGATVQPASYKLNEKLKHVPNIREKLETGQLVALSRSDWVLAAIDFHVSPIAQRLHDQMNSADIQKLCVYYEDSNGLDMVKSWIWDNSSSINWRTASPSPSVSSAAWSRYESAFKELASEFVRKSC